MMNRLKGILVAGTLTGLVLITILALGFDKVRAKPVENTAVTLARPGNSSPATSDTEIKQELQAWQTYSAELEQTVRILQEREAQYQQQLDSANQIIVQLQNELNRTKSARFSDFFGEDESHEFGEIDD